MGLSYDLISEFVKITNDKKENTKEGTVYATVVSGTGGKYVRIDGSDLLTPMDTTTDIEDGERVTLMIKDHKAIVTGNVTTPSASTSKVDKVTESVNSVSDRVGTFELVVADKVSTNELEAYKATIEVLIANKATIEDLTATNAKIENLEVKNAEIENLVAGKATIEDLEAVNATIENLKVKDAEIENAVVENLKATNAEIKVLNADFAQIKTLVNGNLTSDNILSFNLTSEKVTVDDAFIKDAMIDTISAGKINAGKINTNSVSIGSEDGGMLITGSTQQFTDKNGNVRIQIGKDASGDFTFILYGEDGQGQLINQNGITASAISDGLIVNNMVSDHAAISGGKLDISSVITEINGDNSTTINSSKIYLNEQAQSLEVAFNSLKTKVDTIQEVTIQGDLTAIVEQVQSNTSKIEVNKDSISTLIAEDTVIKKQVNDLQGTLSETETTLNSKYTTLSQSLDGFKTTVANTYATKKSVTDVVDNIEANYSTTSVMNSAIEQKAQEISASVSETYATKTQVNTLDDNLKSNYSTTKQMESAISIAKQEINLGVSELYETKSEVTNKINGLSISSVNRVLGSEFSKSKTFTSTDNETWEAYDISEDIRNKKVVIAFDYVATNIVKQSSHSIKFQAFFTTPSGSKSYYPSFDFNLADGNSSGTIISSPVTFGDIKAGTNAKFRFRFDKVSGTLEISKARVFIGTKDLGWSPAPEDIDNNIELAKTEAISSANDTLTSTISNYYTKKQTDSQINIAKEAIDLSVSSTYETKESVASKVESTLDSAKSYADTKKTEAISAAADDATSKANTAKQEAISSADKTLTSTIANYYTKKQTDSQINIAKEAIDLSVSNTYETKTNVEKKINGINIGGRNYLYNSDFSNDLDHWTIHDLTNSTGTNKSVGISNGGQWADPNIKTLRIMATNATGRYGVLSATMNLNANTQYTISGFYAAHRTKVQINVRDVDNDSANIHTVNYEPHNGGNSLSKYKRFITTFTTTANTHYAINLYSLDAGDAAYAWFAQIKLEKGNKATDWNPAQEDIDRNIDTAKSEAINSANDTLTSTISNYYTKKQTDSQINIAKEAIDLSVSNTYETKTNVESKINNIQVGSRNWIQYSSFPSTIQGWSGVNGSVWKITTSETFRGNNSIYANRSGLTTDGWSEVLSNKINVKQGDKVVGSWYIKYRDCDQQSIVALWGYKSDGTGRKDITSSIGLLGTNANWTRYVLKGTVPADVAYVRLAISHKRNGIIFASMPQLEFGDTATDWSPAPEDIDNNIDTAKSEAISSANDTLTSTISNYYTKKQTDSQINIAKEAIDLSVSNTYETKTNVINKINGIEVGGRNLAEQTKSLSNVSGSSEWTVAETGNEGFKKLYIDTTNTGWVECRIPLYTEIYTITRKVTISFEYQESTAGLLLFSLGAYDDGNGRLSELSNVAVSSAFNVISNIGGWKYVSYTFDPTSVNSAENATVYKIQFKKASGLTGKIHIRKPKIEFGTKPTSWSPAPEDISNDMESEFSSIKSETKSLKETVSSLSLGADSISASVKSLEESMVNTTDGLANDISHIQEQVNLKMSTDDVKLEIQKEMSKGANKVSTSTGFTFDQNGLNISKTDSEMKTQITEDGMKIYKNDDIMLTANNQGVDAKNLHATTYLIIGGNSRMEDFTESGSKRTAVFWIG